MNQKNDPDILNLLRKVPLFAGLEEAPLKVIASSAITRDFPGGTVIFNEDMPGRTIYIVVKGRIKIFAELSKRRKKTLVFLNEGDFFGELALLDKPTRSASAETISDTRLLLIEHQDFYRLLKNYPNVSLNLINVLSQRLREADKEIEMLSFFSILGRISKVLLDFEKRYGVKTDRGTELDLPLDKKDIAELVGTVREVATRAVKQLEKVGCIKIENGRIIISDREKLQYFTELK